jgi:hypothetical protein
MGKTTESLTYTQMTKQEYHNFCQKLNDEFWSKCNKLAEAYLYSKYAPLNVGDKVFDPKGSGTLYEIEEVSGYHGGGEPYWLYRVKRLKGYKYGSTNLIKDGPNIKLRPVITTVNSIEDVYKIAKRQAKASKKLLELAFVDSYKLDGIPLSRYNPFFNVTDQELIDELERRNQLRNTNT